MSSSRDKFSSDSAKRRDLKEEKNSLKRSGKHSDDQEDTLKKTKVDDAPKTAIPSGRGPMIKPIKLSQPVPKKAEPKVQLKKASVFDDSSDDEPEEMPEMARMRMKNIGRDTATSAGPNSFGKDSKRGFCDTKKVFERQLNKALEESSD